MTSPNWTPVPILMYHAVPKSAHARPYKHIHVTQPDFAWQMRSLAKRGYHPISFDLLFEAMAGNATLPSKPILLTFDDGFEDLFTNAYPVMTELGFPHTVFLVSDLIGKTNEWMRLENLDEWPLLSWDQIHEMQQNRLVSFQAHTASHPHLTQIPASELQREIVDSRDALEQGLGKRVDVFCYPYGDFNDDIAEFARDAGFRGSVTTQFGRTRQGDDPLKLPRISIYNVPPLSLDYGIGSLNYWWRIETRKDTRQAHDFASAALVG